MDNQSTHQNHTPPQRIELTSLTNKLSTIDRDVHHAFEQLREAQVALEEDRANFARERIQELLSERRTTKEQIADLVAELLGSGT